MFFFYNYLVVQRYSTYPVLSLNNYEEVEELGVEGEERLQFKVFLD